MQFRFSVRECYEFKLSRNLSRFEQVRGIVQWWYSSGRNSFDLHSTGNLLRSFRLCICHQDRKRRRHWGWPCNQLLQAHFHRKVPHSHRNSRDRSGHRRIPSLHAREFDNVSSQERSRTPCHACEQTAHQSNMRCMSHIVRCRRCKDTGRCMRSLYRWKGTGQNHRHIGNRRGSQIDKLLQHCLDIGIVHYRMLL